MYKGKVHNIKLRELQNSFCQKILNYYNFIKKKEF